MNAVEWGEKHSSCESAMTYRRALPIGSTQSDWYMVCHRVDWLLWQLSKLPKCKFAEIRPRIVRFAYREAEISIQFSYEKLKGNDCEWSKKWKRWAEKWLSGENRYCTAAYAAADADAYTDAAAAAHAAYAAAYAYTDAAAHAAYAAYDAAAYTDAAAHAAYAAADAAAYADAAAAAAYDVTGKDQANRLRELIPEWPDVEL